MIGETSHPTGDGERISGSRPSGQSPEAGALPFCGDFDIRIARDGTWFYRGSPIGRKPLVRLFSTVLRREDDGEYWLVTPVERGRVIVEDAPFVAVEMVVSDPGPQQVIRLRTNVDDWVEAGPDHPLRVDHPPGGAQPSPYIMVRDGLEALIVRSVYYRLADMGVERRRGGTRILGVWSKETFFPLGSLD